MAHGMEKGLGPSHIVLDGDPAPVPQKGDRGPGHIVLDGVPALRERGTAAPRFFGPCLLWPRSPISATAELLYKRSPKN